MNVVRLRFLVIGKRILRAIKSNKWNNVKNAIVDLCVHLEKIGITREEMKEFVSFFRARKDLFDRKSFVINEEQVVEMFGMIYDSYLSSGFNQSSVSVLSDEILSIIWGVASERKDKDECFDRITSSFLEILSGIADEE